MSELAVPGARVSVIIPVFGDWLALKQLLQDLEPWSWEVIVVAVDAPPGPEPRARVLTATRQGRGFQLAQGVAAATGEWLWLLHADSRLPAGCVESLRDLIATAPACWGRFDVALASSRRGLRLVEALMNLRSRLTGICTGDQGMFMHADLLRAAGGVPQQPLMEDIELSARLRKSCAPRRLAGPLITSARRWERGGVLRTIGRMWVFRLKYWLGVPAEQLAAEYYASADHRAAAAAAGAEDSVSQADARS